MNKFITIRQKVAAKMHSKQNIETELEGLPPATDEQDDNKGEVRLDKKEAAEIINTLCWDAEK